MENSNIEWCDHTFNGHRGCTKVSPACANCYAEALSIRFGLGEYKKGVPRIRMSAAYWKQPLRWNQIQFRQCGRCGWRGHTDCQNCGVVWSSMKPARQRVFSLSLGDWLDDEVPIEWLADLLKLIHDTPNLDWLLLTKRPENWASRLAACARFRLVGDPQFIWEMKWYEMGIPPENIWIMATVEDQPRADQRIAELIKIPAKVRGLSCEPLLSSLNLRSWIGDTECQNCGWRGFETELRKQPEPCPKCFGEDDGKQDRCIYPVQNEGIDWIICGGESGRGARPMHPDWARGLRDQCQAAGVPFFFKQWGEWLPGAQAQDHQLKILGATDKGHRWENGTTSWRVGKKEAGRLLDGREWNEFPGEGLVSSASAGAGV